MNTNGWDTISVLDIAQVNRQLSTRLSELMITFDTSWDDAFSGSYHASGQFGPWSITGGSSSDIYLTLPILSGTLAPAAGGSSTDISGMAVQVEVNLEWVPSSVTSGASNLQFDLTTVTDPNATRQPGGISVMKVTDPNGTGFGAEVGSGIAHALVDNTDKISFIFAQTGIVDTDTATWLLPVRSTYSYQTPQGSSSGYLAILSVTTDRDISGLSSNIDAGIIDSSAPLAFVISGDLFLQHAILPALPGAFPGTSANNFGYANGQITLAAAFNMSGILVGAVTYIPKVTSLSITVDGTALASSAAGTCDLDMPNAYMTFSASSTNVLAYDVASQSFTFIKDPHPRTRSDSQVPWYDYLIGLGPLGAAIIASVLAVVESGVAASMAGSTLAGSLAAAPASTVQWAGLDQVAITSGALDDCFIMHATVS